jgi:hypothetical protein
MRQAQGADVYARVRVCVCKDVCVCVCVCEDVCVSAWVWCVQADACKYLHSESCNVHR